MNHKKIAIQLKKGNKSALEELFNCYYDYLVRYALKLTLNHEYAEEMVQDIFISLWENREKREITNFQSYLIKAVKYKCYDYFKRNHHTFEQIDDDLLINDKYVATPVEEIENKQLEELIAEALQKLPKKCGIIFSLSRNSGLSYKEIAEQLDLSIKTVENQIGIALKKIRELLSNYFE